MNIRVRLTFSIGTNGLIHQAKFNLKDISIFHTFFSVAFIPFSIGRYKYLFYWLYSMCVKLIIIYRKIWTLRCIIGHRKWRVRVWGLCVRFFYLTIFLLIMHANTYTTRRLGKILIIFLIHIQTIILLENIRKTRWKFVLVFINHITWT